MKEKTVYYCTECGNEFPKWQGKCPFCGSWNTIVERPHTKKAASSSSSLSSSRREGRRVPIRISEVESTQELRFHTGMNELDRVLGGGAVKGSLVLIAGAPGIGKSTLMLQICDNLGKFAKVLYISGEESEKQIKLRADRLHIHGENLYICSETVLSSITESIDELNPDIIIVDSIQTIYDNESNTLPGSISQVRECASVLMQIAKSRGITIFVIGHINKEGSIAGPKILEHMVDCVLYFEGAEHSSHRILRAAKNRFGATNEIGVFEMQQYGLTEVPNPSEILLDGRPTEVPGSCVTCVMEGNRPILAEVQALVAPTAYGNARRVSNGFDYNRAVLLLAILEKRGGLLLNTCDTYINVVGGLYISEPSADLAVMLSLASSFRDKVIPKDLAAFGEAGLTGELRSVNFMDQRLSEIRRLGFTKCIVPSRALKNIKAPDGLQLIPVRNIREALAIIQ